MRGQSGRARGQHFLRSDVARRFVAHAGIGAGDLVFDLGAGTGTLTVLLAVRADRVVAVERDPKLARRLARRVDGFDNVSVHVREIAAIHLPHRPFRVVANLPFSGSNAVVRRLLDSRLALLGADLIVELGVARAWARRSPRCEVVCRLAPDAFVPAPGCEAAVLRIRR